MVVDGNRQHLLGPRLADDIVVEHLVDFVRRRQLGLVGIALFLDFLADDVVAQVDAFVADEHPMSFLTSC